MAGQFKFDQLIMMPFIITKIKIQALLISVLFLSCEWFLPEPELCFDPESSIFVEPSFEINFPDTIYNYDYTFSWEGNGYCSEVECQSKFIYHYNGQIFYQSNWINYGEDPDSIEIDVEYLDEGQYDAEIQCRYDILDENGNYAVYSEIYNQNFNINAVEPNSIVLFPRYSNYTINEQVDIYLLAEQIELDTLSGSGLIGIHAMVSFGEGIEYIGYEDRFSDQFWVSIENSEMDVIAETNINGQNSLIVDFSTGLSDTKGINNSTDTLLQLRFDAALTGDYMIEFDSLNTKFFRFANEDGTIYEEIPIKAQIPSHIKIQ